MNTTRSYLDLVQLAARGAMAAHLSGKTSSRSFEKILRPLTLVLAVAMTAGLATSATDALANRGPSNGGFSNANPSMILEPEITVAPTKVIEFRADAANGSFAYPEGTRDTPWVDLVNDHDGILWNFQANTASGWAGNGSVASPYRLEFNGREERVVIPAGSVPELQQVGPLTVEVWFKTSFDAASGRYDYILEWVQAPTPDLDPLYEGRGMSIAVNNGRIKVYDNPWVDAGPAAPNTWYHVAVVKDTLDMRVYVNGERVFTGTYAHQGIQQSEIVLGCSTFRAFEPVGFYGDYGNVAIASFTLWNGKLDDAAVLASYQARTNFYQPAPSPELTKVLDLRAKKADGQGPYVSPLAGIEWTDLVTASNEAQLLNFDGTATSGWNGNGTFASPYRLQFDGIDDVAAVPAASIPELQNVTETSAAMWLKTPATLPTTDYQYLIEWLEGFHVSNGMALAIHDGALQIYARHTAYPFTRDWLSVLPLEADRWYFVTCTKKPGEVDVYVDGRKVFTGGGTELGDAETEITIGASTWRGAGIYGDHFAGAFGEVGIWVGALDAGQIMDAYKAGYADYNPIAIPRHRGNIESAAMMTSLQLSGLQPNPAVDHLNVAFTLPSAQDATLELLDVAGRRVATRRVGSFGAGQHTVDLSEGSRMPAAGVYFVRLTQGNQSLIKKAIVMSR